MPDCWRVQVLHVHVQLSMHQFSRDLSPGPPTSVKPSTEGRTTRPWLGNLFARVPVLLSSTALSGTTSAIPSRCVRVSRSSPVTSNFTISLCRGPGLALVWSPLQPGRFIYELIGKRTYTCSQHVSGFGFVFSQCEIRNHMLLFP